MTALAAVTNYGATPPFVQVDVSSAPVKPTSAYASNFSAGVDSWSAFGTGVGLTNDTTRTPAALKLTAPANTLGEVHAARALTGLTVGAQYKITAYVQSQIGAVKLAVREAAEGTEIAQGSYRAASNRVAITLTFTATIANQVIEVFTKAIYATGSQPTVWVDTITVDNATAWQGTTITRTDVNGTNVPVRLSPGLDTVGVPGFTIYDYEAALTGTVNYTVTDGLGGTASATAAASGGGSTVTVPQTVIGTQGSLGTSTTVAIAALAAGDVVVLYRSATGTTTVVTGVAGLGGTWTRVATPNAFSGYVNEWWIGTGCTGSGNITVTASGTVNGVQRAFVVRGLTSATPNLVVGNASSSASTLTGTPVSAQLGQVVLQSHYTGNTTSLGTVTQTPAAGWTNQAASSNAVYGTRNTGYRIPTETTATAHNATVTPPASNTIAIETLVIGGAAPPPAPVVLAPSLTLPATGLRANNVDDPDYAPVTMVTNYEGARDTLGAVHEILGRQTKLSNPGALSARSGTLEIFAQTYAEALAISNLLGRPEVAMIRQQDYPGLDMYFQARTVGIRPEPPTTTRRWTVSVAYDEVPRP